MAGFRHFRHPLNRPFTGIRPAQGHLRLGQAKGGGAFQHVGGRDLRRVHRHLSRATATRTGSATSTTGPASRCRHHRARARFRAQPDKGLIGQFRPRNRAARGKGMGRAAQHPEPVGKQRAERNIGQGMPFPGNAEIRLVARHRLMHLARVQLVQAKPCIGMFIDKPADHAGQNARQDRGRGGNADRPANPLGQRIKIAKRLFKLADQPACGGQKPRARGAQRHLARRAIKKRRARHILELPDRRRQSRRRQPQNLRRSGKSAMIGDRHKNPHMAQTDGRQHVSSANWLTGLQH